MTAVQDLEAAHPELWNTAWGTGYRRGTADGDAETGGWYTRNHDHDGRPDEPPPLEPEQREVWIAAFVDGYATGRADAIGGAA